MLRADLHIHTCLSPCGDLEMGPEAVLMKAQELELTTIAITDHNSTQNCRAFIEYASKTNIRVIPGIEVTSSEEAHILCYFDSLEKAEEFGRLVEESLLPIPLDEEAMGMQIVVNSEEEVVDMVENYLSVASSYSTSDIVILAHEYGGVVVPAHVDKPVYSLISQLGFITDDPFDAIEISYGCLKRDEAKLFNFKSVVSGSDAHYPDDIGRVTFSAECEFDAPVAEILGTVQELSLTKL